MTGRFISQDPTGFGGGDVNLYRYCGNSPASNTDPTGLQSTNGYYSASVNISNAPVWVATTFPVMNTPQAMASQGQLVACAVGPDEPEVPPNPGVPEDAQVNEELVKLNKLLIGCKYAVTQTT